MASCRTQETKKKARRSITRMFLELMFIYEIELVEKWKRVRRGLKVTKVEMRWVLSDSQKKKKDGGVLTS